MTDLLRDVPVFFSLSIAFLSSGLLNIHRFREFSLHVPTILNGFVGIWGFHALFFFALHSAPPIEATLLVDIWPIQIILFSPLLFPAFRLRPRHYLAMLLGLAGMILIVSNGRIDFDLQYTQGYSLALLASLFWSGYSLFSKKLPPYSPVTISLFCLLAAGASFIVHLLFEPAATPQLWQIGIMICMGLGPLGGAFFSWDAALKQGDTRVIGALSFLIPMISVIWLIFFRGHQLTLISMLAMILIISASIIGSVERNRQNKLKNS